MFLNGSLTTFSTAPWHITHDFSRPQQRPNTAPWHGVKLGLTCSTRIQMPSCLNMLTTMCQCDLKFMHVIMGFLVGFIYVLQQQWSLEKKKSRKDLKVGVLKTQQVSEQSHYILKKEIYLQHSQCWIQLSWTCYTLVIFGFLWLHAMTRKRELRTSPGLIVPVRVAWVWKVRVTQHLYPINIYI